MEKKATKGRMEWGFQRCLGTWVPVMEKKAMRGRREQVSRDTPGTRPRISEFQPVKGGNCCWVQDRGKLLIPYFVPDPNIMIRNMCKN